MTADDLPAAGGGDTTETESTGRPEAEDQGAWPADVDVPDRPVDGTEQKRWFAPVREPDGPADDDRREDLGGLPDTRVNRSESDQSPGPDSGDPKADGPAGVGELLPGGLAGVRALRANRLAEVAEVRADRLADVGRLRERAAGVDREAAVAARAALSRMVADDSREVATAAEEALAATSVGLEPGRIDFGPVSPGTPQLVAAVKVTGPPMALASELRVTGAGLRARIAGDQLQVAWLPGDGPLAGIVSLNGPAGAADLPVSGHIAAAMTNGVPTRADLPVAGRVDVEPMISGVGEARENVPVGRGGLEATVRPGIGLPDAGRRGKGLLIAAVTAVVLLAGTGIAAAVTLKSDKSPNGRAAGIPASPIRESAPPGKGPRPAPGDRQSAQPGDPGGQPGAQGAQPDAPGAAPAEGTQPGAQGSAPVASRDKPVVQGTIRVGDEPEGLAISPDGRVLYVANQSSRILSVVDLASGKVGQVTLRNTPRFVAVARDGKRVFVSMYEDDLSGSGVAVVDAQARKVERNLGTGVQPYALSVAPDGRLWVPIHGGRNVEIFSAGELRPVGRVFVPENPHAVSFDAGGRRAFTPDHESSTVSVIDTRTDQRLRSIPVSRAPHSLAVAPDGRTVVVACFEADAVDLIDAVTLERRGTLPVGDKPQAAAFAMDSRHAYAVNEAGDSVSVLDPRAGKVTATVPVGDSPRAMAVSPDGRFAYVSNGRDDTVSVLRVG